MKLEQSKQDEIDRRNQRIMEVERIANEEREAMLATGNRAERRAAVARAFATKASLVF